MDASGGKRNRWQVALGGLVLAVATSGCSALISCIGVSSVSEIEKPQTRAEVRAAFGAADETRTCPDGRIVERRSFLQETGWAVADTPDWARPSGGVGALTGPGAVFLFGLVEAVAIPVQLSRMEQATLRYVFVYGPDERVLYRYDIASLSVFRDEVLPITDSLTLQLKEGGCPSWEGCVRAYAADVRQRVTCFGYTLTTEDEALLQRLHTVAIDADAGRISKTDALAEIKACAWVGSAYNPCPPRPPRD